MKRGPWLLAVAMLQPGILCMAGMQKTSEADTRLQAEAHRMDLSACPAVMRGPGCQQAKALPKCINGVFRGPLTLSKNGFHNDSHAAEYGVTDPAHFAALPPQDFMGSLRRPSCALVTSGSNILKTGWGGAIDAHDVVVRLNNAPSKKFEKDVGSRTDLRYTNGYYEGSRDSKLEAVIAGKWCPKGGLLVGPQGKPCEEPDLMRVLQKKAHPLNPDFLMYVKSEYFTRVGHNPSAGFVATLLLLHSCRSVHMYGFHIMADQQHGGHDMKAWYYVDHLWHKDFQELKKHRPSDSEMYQHKKWTVKEWTYASSQQQTARTTKSLVAPSYIQLAPSKSTRRAPPLPKAGMGMGLGVGMGMGLRVGMGMRTDGTNRGPIARAAARAVAQQRQRRGARRRLLKSGQSDTILVEKHCMRELYKSKLIEMTDS